MVRSGPKHYLRYYVYDTKPDEKKLHPDGVPRPTREREILGHIVRNHPKGHFLDRYLSNLEMPLVYSPGEVDLPCRETMEEFEAVNAHFSEHIHSLFKALKACEEVSAGNELPRIDENGMRLGLQIGPQSYNIVQYCWHRNTHSHRLHLNDAADLTSVSRIRKLEVLSSRLFDLYHYNRPVSPGFLVECAVRLPDLQELECQWVWERMEGNYTYPAVRHFTHVWEGQWRDSRHDFGRAVDELHKQLPQSLKKATLLFWRPEHDGSEDQSVAMPNLIQPADEDPVSAGLRTLASGLEELHVRAFLTPDLFKTPQCWEKMKRLRVHFHPLRPDGSWYFVGPRGEDPHHEGFEVTDAHYTPTGPNEKDMEWDECWGENGGDDDDFEPHVFRTEPHADRIEPLLSAFAMALKDMPALEEAELFTYLSWCPSDEMAAKYGDDAPYDVECSHHRWGVRYIPGENGSKGIVEWQVGEWRPREYLVKLFRDLRQDGGIEIIWKAFELRRMPSVEYDSTIIM